MQRRYGLDPTLEPRDYSGHELAGEIAEAEVHCKRWTEGELETLARSDLSISEAARLLRRTYRSVQTKRNKMARADG